MPGTLAVMREKRSSLRRWASSASTCTSEAARMASLARASSAVRSATRASSCSWVCWMASSARLRSVMSRTRASSRRWLPLRKTATRSSVGNVVPSLRRWVPVMVMAMPGTICFHLSRPLAASNEVSISDREREQIRAGVAEAVARLLVHVDDPAREVVDEERLARLFDEVPETFLALAQGGLVFLALGDVLRDDGDVRRFAGLRVADEKKRPRNLDGRAGLEVAEAEVALPSAGAHEVGRDGAEEIGTVLAHEVIDQARAADGFLALQADELLPGAVEVVELAVEAGEADEIRTALDKLLEADVFHRTRALARPSRSARMEALSRVSSRRRASRWAGGWRRRRRAGAQGRSSCPAGATARPRGRGRRAVASPSRAAKSWSSWRSKARSWRGRGVEQAEPFAGIAGGVGVGVGGGNGGGGEETQARRTGQGRGDGGGEVGVVLQVGHDEEVAHGVEERGVAEQFGAQARGLLTAASGDTPAFGSVLENHRGGCFEHARGQRRYPLEGGVRGRRFDR